MPRATSGVSALTGAIVIKLRKPARLRNLEVPFLLGAVLVTVAAIALVDTATGAAFDSMPASCCSCSSCTSCCESQRPMRTRS